MSAWVGGARPSTVRVAGQVRLLFDQVDEVGQAAVVGGQVTVIGIKNHLGYARPP